MNVEGTADFDGVDPADLNPGPDCGLTLFEEAGDLFDGYEFSAVFKETLNQINHWGSISPSDVQGF